MGKQARRIMKGRNPAAPLSVNAAAGQRLRLFRIKILKLDTIGALAAKLGFLPHRDNRVGNWERGHPFHKYVVEIARLRAGLSSAWFYTGALAGTSMDVAQEISAAEAEARAEGWYTIPPNPGSSG